MHIHESVAAHVGLAIARTSSFVAANLTMDGCVALNLASLHFNTVGAADVKNVAITGGTATSSESGTAGALGLYDTRLSFDNLTMSDCSSVQVCGRVGGGKERVR